MLPISYSRHQFPPEVIQHAVWLYLRFTLSYRDVEDLLAEGGLDISYETIRRWVLKFGPAVARRLRQLIPRPSDQNLCAQSRSPMDMMRHGWSASLFQASQQWSTIAS